MSILDRMEAGDPAYRGAYSWHCPAGCGTVLVPHEDGLFCRTCRRPVSWAELAASDTAD